MVLSRTQHRENTARGISKRAAHAHARTVCVVAELLLLLPDPACSPTSTPAQRHVLSLFSVTQHLAYLRWGDLPEGSRAERAADKPAKVICFPSFLAPSPTYLMAPGDLVAPALSGEGVHIATGHGRRSQRIALDGAV